MTKKRARFLLSLLDFKLPDHKNHTNQYCECIDYIQSKLKEQSRVNNNQYCKLIIKSKYYNDIKRSFSWIDWPISYGLLRMSALNKEVDRYLWLLDIRNFLIFLGTIMILFMILCFSPFIWTRSFHG